MSLPVSAVGNSPIGRIVAVFVFEPPNKARARFSDSIDTVDSIEKPLVFRRSRVSFEASDIDLGEIGFVVVLV